MLKFKSVLLAAVFALLGISSAVAADERFSVAVDVDVTAADASQARERAMTEANRAAFLEVSRRITTADGAARLAAMTDAQLLNFIKEVAVEDEKSSSVRYMATLRIVLNEDMLREYMKERQIPLLVQSSSRILVVPVFREFESDPPLLWESTNLWREAWDKAPREGSVRFIPLPVSGTNYAIIDAGKALAMDGEALDKLMLVNGADDVYVLDAVYDGIDGLIVRASSYSGNTQTFRITGARSSGSALFDKAVSEVSAQLSAQLQQQSLDENAKENQAVVLFNFEKLRQWVEAENVLHSVPYIKNIEMQAMGTNKAQFKLTYIGSAEKLLHALRAKSFNLSERGSFWIMEKY